MVLPANKIIEQTAFDDSILGQPKFVQLEAEACQGWRGEIRLNNHICQVVICLTVRAFELIHFESMNAG
jgi:hypothetical protein